MDECKKCGAEVDKTCPNCEGCKACCKCEKPDVKEGDVLEVPEGDDQKKHTPEESKAY